MSGPAIVLLSPAEVVANPWQALEGVPDVARCDGMRSGAAKRVLVVEDDPGVREMVLFHLRLAHYDATAAHDGKAGLEILRSRPFDLVILDLMLPGIDGITLCQMVREEGPNKEVPILMLTAETGRIRQGPRPQERRGRLSDEAVRRP